MESTVRINNKKFVIYHNVDTSVRFLRSDLTYIVNQTGIEKIQKNKRIPVTQTCQAYRGNEPVGDPISVTLYEYIRLT